MEPQPHSPKCFRWMSNEYLYCTPSRWTSFHSRILPRAGRCCPASVLRSIQSEASMCSCMRPALCSHPVFANRLRTIHSLTCSLEKIPLLQRAVGLSASHPSGRLRPEARLVCLCAYLCISVHMHQGFVFVCAHHIGSQKRTSVISAYARAKRLRHSLAQSPSGRAAP